jgi:hypothetical protein
MQRQWLQLFSGPVAWAWAVAVLAVCCLDFRHSRTIASSIASITASITASTITSTIAITSSIASTVASAVACLYLLTTIHFFTAAITVESTAHISRHLTVGIKRRRSTQRGGLPTQHQHHQHY